MLRYGDGEGEMESKGQWRFNTPTPPTRTIYFYVPIIFGPTKSNIEEKNGYNKTCHRALFIFPSY